MLICTDLHMFGDGMTPGMSVQFLPIYSLLLALYLGGAGYYRCGDVLGDSSLAHFSGSLDAVLALGWSAWILLGMRWLRDVPKPTGRRCPHRGFRRFRFPVRERTRRVGWGNSSGSSCGRRFAEFLFSFGQITRESSFLAWKGPAMPRCFLTQVALPGASSLHALHGLCHGG